ncbi:glycosyltransferase family 4 protein [Flavobacteriaceae bacterium]|nr:glycosyltransferase family 4 protein [Algibacter sp.]MDA9069407.1 glycosyltransferase family 4 protein [Algibacter sp.]MDB9859413.1 glycosyltransferase family 4 protein [Flavobacteriaceae bacterium]
MKILLVSMSSLHFFRWSEQLENSGHDVYWFDILDGSPTERLPWVKKINGWRLKYPNLKGRYFIKEKLPFLYKFLKPSIENSVEKAFEKTLLDVKPDLVHSFVLYISCTPILKVMLKHKNIPWVYSSWGSDLFYFQNEAKYLYEIKKVLPRVDYLFADCHRDITIAKKYGFKDYVLGVFPGGGGFDFKEANAFINPVTERQIILVKGYQGRSGKAIQVIKALGLISEEIKNYSIVVFGTDPDVENYITKQGLKRTLSIKYFSIKDFLPHNEILKLMGEALIYIGNSNSDGMPNTLLEAMIQGAFPIQSNPGGATAEVIEHGENGLLIEDCEDSNKIAQLIREAINNPNLINKAFVINQEKIKPNYNRDFIKEQVISRYESIC